MLCPHFQGFLKGTGKGELCVTGAMSQTCQGSSPVYL